MATVKRYLLFLYDNYEPSGGWDDYSGASDDVGELLELAAHARHDYYQVVDLEKLDAIYEGVPRELLRRYQEGSANAK